MSELLLPFHKTAQIEHAQYCEHELEWTHGNPCIEAFNPPLSRTQIKEVLTKKITFLPHEREMAAHLRFQNLPRLTDCYYPTSTSIDISQSFMAGMWSSYRNRNYMDVIARQKLLKAEKSFAKGFFESNSIIRSAPEHMLTIIGFSGGGKTALRNQILSSIPQVIHHSKYKNKDISLTQITYITLDAPVNFQIPSLVKDIIRKISAAVGVDYLQERTAKTVTGDLLGLLANLCCGHMLGAIWVDEAQELFNTQGKKSLDLVRLYLRLSNALGIAIIFTGTLELNHLNQETFALARRATAGGYYEILRFDHTPGSRVSSFYQFLSMFWEGGFLIRCPPELTDSMVDAFAECTWGVAQLVVSLFRKVQERVLLREKETFNEELVYSVFDKEMKLIKEQFTAHRASSGTFHGPKPDFNSKSLDPSLLPKEPRL